MSVTNQHIMLYAFLYASYKVTSSMTKSSPQSRVVWSSFSVTFPSILSIKCPSGLRLYLVRLGPRSSMDALLPPAAPRKACVPAAVPTARKKCVRPTWRRQEPLKRAGRATQVTTHPNTGAHGVASQKSMGSSWVILHKQIIKESVH